MNHENTKRNGLAQDQNDEIGTSSWMYMRAIAVMAGCGYGSILLVASLVSGVIGWIAFAIGVVAMVLSIISIRFPLVAAIMQTLLWACICMVPALSELSWALFLSFAATLMLVSFRYTGLGIGLGIVQSSVTVVSHAMLGMSGASPSPIFDMIAVVALPAASCIGVGMQWRIRLMRMQQIRHELDRQREINEERRRRELIAATLHDQVTNRLAYQILRMQHDIRTWCEQPPQSEQYQAEISELLDISQDLLEKIRATIDVLGSETIADNESHDRVELPKSRMSPAPETEQEMLDAHLTQAKEEMRELGFAVNTQLLGTMPLSYDPKVLDIVHTGIDEFTSNMIKYADPIKECSLIVNITAADITVISSNTCNTKSSCYTARAITGGRGLSQLRIKAKDINGTLSKDNSGKESISRLSIPWQ